MTPIIIAISVCLCLSLFAAGAYLPEPIIIRTRLLPPGAGAMTVFPLVLLHPNGTYALLHELVHWEQQRLWAMYGVGLGLLVWWLLYLCVLPVGWNPFRAKWETEAFVVEGRDDTEIAKALKRKPYYLWWQK